MDDNRLQAYASLIKELLSCSSYEEVSEVLQANQQLIDATLPKIMAEAAEVYANRGDRKAAACLYCYRGDLLANFRQINSAIASYDKALEHQPNMAVVWVQKGNLLQQKLGKHEEAIICFRRALYYKSDWVNILNLLAISLCTLGNYQEALDSYERFLAVKPEFTDIWFNRACLLMQLEHHEKALSDFNKVLRLQPDYYQAWYFRGNILQKQANYKEAVASYNEALKIKPDFPEAWFEKSVALNHLENIEEWIVSLRRAWELEPNNSQISQMYETLLSELEKFPVEEIELLAVKLLLQGHNSTARWLQKLAGKPIYDTHLKLIEEMEQELYFCRIQGNKENNIQQSIRFCELALEIFTRENYPESWAKVKNQLGQSYGEGVIGNKLRNLEVAISHFNAALEICTREDYPENWAIMQAALGSAYVSSVNRQNLENIQNLELALQAYNSALEILNSENIPEKWAHIQRDLGRIYLDRQIGDRTENVEKSIQAYNSALSFFIPQLYPEQYAEIQCELGEAFKERTNADIVDNVEKAINALQEARKYITPLQSPNLWSVIHNRLGLAYLYRIKGENEENLKQAIKSFEVDLQVTDRQTSPKEWASIKLNLGIAYSHKIKEATKRKPSGNQYWDKFGRSGEYDKEGNFEKAILEFEAALQVYTQHEEPYKWATIQHNLGDTYANKENSDNLEKAFKAYKAALEVRTREATPLYWAMTQYYLGRAYLKKAYTNENRENKEENIVQAINFFNAALEIYTRQTYSSSYASISEVIGHTYFMQANNFKDNKTEKFLALQNAYEALKNAIDTVETLRTEIISGDESKQKIAEQYQSNYELLVDICLQLNKPKEALEYVEKSKNRNLVELIFSKDLHSIFPEDVAIKIEQLRKEIFKIQYQLQNVDINNINILKQRLQELREEEYNELQNHYLPLGSRFDFDRFRLNLDEYTAVVEFYLTSDNIFTFIFTRSTEKPIVLSFDLEEHSIIRRESSNLSDAMTKREKIKALVNGQFGTYYGDKNQWRKQLRSLLQELATVLDINEIVKEIFKLIPQTCAQLIFIPHQVLHLFPLHALPAQSSCLLDLFPNGVSYVPGLQILQQLKQRNRPNVTSIFAIQNPTEDLMYTNLEVDSILNLFSSHQVLSKKQATKDALLKQIAHIREANYLHFSCHGSFNLNSPQDSCLLLAESVDKNNNLDLSKCLTLSNLFERDYQLDSCRLVVLSACETGLVDFDNGSDEFISLPSGFLYAGSTSVVSSLWTVNDFSTAFLMIKFYENLQSQTSVAVALNQAQIWLRNITKAELKTWITANSLSLNPTMQRNLSRRLHKLQDTQKPFQEPFHWAAFCAIGQ